MMKRSLAFFLISFLICIAARANEEYVITLEKGNTKPVLIELPYANFSFRLIENGTYNRVVISIENTTVSQAILLFKNSANEKSLKKGRPKIQFDKTYPASKGNRNVLGCKYLMTDVTTIIPQNKMEFGFETSAPSVNNIELPVYLAKYNPKRLLKKGPDNINYKILREDILDFKIEIKGWTETDPEYVKIKKSVEDYLNSLQNVSFCPNKKHHPELSEQQKPYLAKKDSLISVIDSTLSQHREWFSNDLPHIKYSELLSQLNNVNLDKYTTDCNNHNPKNGKKRRDQSGQPQPYSQQHSCSYCTLSPQSVYHQLDDIYQQLRTGKLPKAAAVSKAQALFNCWQNNSKRKKDSGYADKISKFHSRIINY